MKTILHTTDFSENAITALKYAHKLSKKAKAKLHIVHVTNFALLSTNVIEPYYVPIGGNITQKYEELREFSSTHLGTEFNSKNVTIEIIENNYVVEGIILKANEIKASILVTGMKGSNILKDFLIGNTTKELIEKAPCPVLAIPNNVFLKQIKTIVYATDFEEEDVAAIYDLTEIAKIFDASVKIVHVSKNKEVDSSQDLEWFKEILKQQVNYTKIQYELLYSDETFTALYEYCHEVNADLIAMLERGEKGLSKKIFHRGLVKKMESKSDIPLISFNELNYQYS